MERKKKGNVLEDDVGLLGHSRPAAEGRVSL